MEEEKRSQKHIEAREALPPDLHRPFDELVADYKFAGLQHYNQPFVSYLILADLVREGWRCTVERRRPQA